MPAFDGVVYYLSEAFSPSRRANLSHVLQLEGATAGPLDAATHVVTNSAEFQGRYELRADVAVVTVSVLLPICFL